MPGPDAPVEDNAVPPPTDSGTPPEKDADAGVTPPTDAPVDAPPDALFEAGEVDAAALLAFPTQLAQAVCARFATCCCSLPPETRRRSTCPSASPPTAAAGYQGSTTRGRPPRQREAFLARSCEGAVLPVPGRRGQTACANLRYECSGRSRSCPRASGHLTGTQQAGQGCASAIECAPRSVLHARWRIPRTMRGIPASARLSEGLGRGCADFGVNNSNASETICSYRGSGEYRRRLHTTRTSRPGSSLLTQRPGNVRRNRLSRTGCNVNVDCTSHALCDPGPDPFNNPLWRLHKCGDVHLSLRLPDVHQGRRSLRRTAPDRVEPLQRRRFRVAAHVHARRFDDEVVVLDLGAGEYYSLDAVGSRRSAGAGTGASRRPRRIS